MAAKKKNELAKKSEKLAPIKIGRPTDYTDAFADFICDKIASSDKGLAILLEEEDNMPSHAACYRWLAQFPYFRERYSRARALQADYIADKIVQIANTPIEMEVQEDGFNAYGSFSKTTKADAVNHRRLLINALQWKASKLAPEKYGDKIDFTTQGEKLEPTVIQWGNKKIQV